MPRSPLTLALGLAIVAAFFLVLLWPDQAAQEFGWQAAMSLPIVIGLFTWRAVKDAAPLDDQAFHRTLPPGDGHAFRKVLAVHGWVLIGIALAVVVYCWIFNFGWQVMSYGVLAVTLPAWGLMAAHGIAASLATSRQFGKIWGYVAVFAVPIFSLTLIYYLRENLHPQESSSIQYFNSIRVIVVVAAVLYPMIWWLVAVRRRKMTALCLGTVTSALMPYMYIYGGFFNVTGDSYSVGRDSDGPDLSRVIVTRKFVPPDGDRWIPIESTISLDGLRKGEFVQTWGMTVREKYFGFFEVPDDANLREEGVISNYPVMAAVEEGQIVWGEAAVWKQLQKQIPGLDTLDYWSGGMDVPIRISTLRPGESTLIKPRRGRSHFKPKLFESRMADEDLNNTSWRLTRGTVFRFEKAGELDAASGGTIRLPEGGVLRIDPLAREGEDFVIRMEYFGQDLKKADGPWFGIPRENTIWPLEPWLIAVDSNRKLAFALSGFGYGNEREMLLGEVGAGSFDAGTAKNRNDLARMEKLRGCRLYVFWPKVVGQFRQNIPPPR